MAKILMLNKRAKFDYNILDKYQAGLSLPTPLVKAIRGKRIQLNGVYVVAQRGGLEMIGLKYQDTDYTVPLLLNKKEMDKIKGKLSEKGVTCVALNIKAEGRWIKSDIAVVSSKNNYDKRQTIKKRDLDRDEQRGEL